MKSIYEKLKNNKQYNGGEGKEELKYLYYYPKPPIGIQVLLAKDLIDNIIEISKNEEPSVFLNINDVPLVCYSNIFMEKLNALVKEEIISESWIREFTTNLIYEGEDIKGVQLGLILSEKYLENERLLDVVNVFSKSGDYVFYLLNSIKNLQKYNSYLLDLAKKSTGSIKVFAVTNIEILNSDIRDYLVEEGYKDEAEEVLLINYIMSTVNIEGYMEYTNLSKEKVKRLGYLLQSYIRHSDFNNIVNRQIFLDRFVSIAMEKGEDIYILYSLVLIVNEITSLDNITEKQREIIHRIKNELSNDKWENIFKESIDDYSLPAVCIIDVANFYGYKLSLTQLLPFQKKMKRDISIYEYISSKGSSDEKLQLFKFFSEVFNIDELTKKAEDIETEKLNSNYIDDMILFYIIKSLKKIYAEGRSLAFKALKAKINDSRYEAINILERYEGFTKREIAIIKDAIETEPCKKLENKMRALIENKSGPKKEFVSTDNIKVVSFVDDIYLMSTNIAGSSYRNQSYLQDELETSRKYYLTLEEDNPYDNNAVKIVGESGYVVGYIPKDKNTILSNLLRSGKYLYAKVKEYDLSEAYIKINVYLSLKDVLDYCQDTINLIGLPSGDEQ